MDLSGKHVTIMGLGRHGGGVAAARYAAREGAIVTVTDLADEEALRDSLEALADENIDCYALGGHRDEDFCSADVVVVNPAVRSGNRLVALARDCGMMVTTEIEMFLRECPARVIGVTGTNGKSTTASMIAAILKDDGRRFWLGGNIGRSLLPELARIERDDWVVLELSSFQLAQLSDDLPNVDVAVVTGCTPDHLDWHGCYGEYVKAKQRILLGQSPDGIAVLESRDREVAGWTPLVKGQIVEPIVDEQLPPLRIAGHRNRTNATLAAAAARAAGASDDAIGQGLASFVGLPHRLAALGEIDGRTFYNDSKATTPDATLAAINAIDAPTWALLGGESKGASFDSLARRLVGRCAGAAVFGADRSAIAREIESVSPSFRHTARETLADALRWCWDNSRPGDAILLSPACASFDQFDDFAHRGEEFARLVAQIRHAAVHVAPSANSNPLV